MKKLMFILLICLSQITFVNGQGNDPEKLLNAAIYEEEVNGNLQEAIRLYEEIVKNFPEDRPVVAEALYRNGLANERLGNLKARQYYEKVINNYSDQPELVQLAQIRLSRMLKTEKPASEELSVINLNEKGSDIQKGTRLHQSSLSPDGTKMVGINYFPSGQNVAVYDRKTKKIQLITKYDWSSEGHGYTYFPTWSPDGKKVAYMFAGWKGGYELQISSLKGEIQTLIKNEIEAQIIPRQWSQDGSKILTFKQDTSGFYTIGFVSVKGGSFKALYKPQWESQFVTGDASLASLSPDGRFVVFSDGPEEKLDIFIINTEGGTATVLSDHPANENTVVWSQDGKHIAFIRETKGGSLLYAVEMAEGKPVGPPFLIKEGMQNVDLNNWTEHGICYNLWLDLHDIHTLPLNPETGTPTGDPKLLDYTPTGSNICPVWSHDGKHIAFISYADIPKVVILPADGGEPRNFTIPAFGLWAPSVFDLRWLPDNSGVGFSNSMGRINSTTAYRLDIITGRWQNWLLPMTDNWTRIDWGPDENSFVYTKWYDIDSDEDIPDSGLHQFNIKTGETQHIFKPEADTGNTFRKMKFSRDHKKLVFRSQNKNLMVLDLESGESRVLTQKFWTPTFSPDGQKILTFGAKYGVAVLSLDGEILQQYSLARHFISGTRISSSDWSPDGKQLVFMTRNMKYETYLMKNVLK